MRPLSFSELSASRRERNASALAAFGVAATRCDAAGELVRPGDDPTIFTIGYERRRGDELMALLVQAGVEVLVDVRQRAFSRVPDFRLRRLSNFCAEAGVEYQVYNGLGSTDELRDDLRATGDFRQFASRFRRLAVKSMGEPLGQLAELATERRVALLCYERCHGECHRSVVADLIADRTGGRVVAL